MAPTAFFMHIPKTGGTAIRKTLERVIRRPHIFGVYGWEAEQELGRAERSTIESYRLVAGHFRIAMWLRMPGFPLVTMLREPVDRVASHYRYARSWDKDPFHEEALQLTLTEFALADLRRSLNNCQTHNLSTADVPRAQDAMLALPPYGGLSMSDADEAIGYVQRPDVLPGLHEAFAESVALTSVWLDIEPPAILEANRSPDRAGDDLAPTERAAIAKKNALDVQVYEAARDAFWDKWRAAGSDAARALVRVRGKQPRAPRLRSWQEMRLRQAKQAARRLLRRSA